MHVGLRHRWPGLALLFLLLLCVPLAVLVWLVESDQVTATQGGGMTVATQVGAAGDDGSRLYFPGGVRTQDVRLTLALPESSQERWILWFPRDPFEEVRVSAPGWTPATLSYFNPRSQYGVLATGFGFKLPEDWHGRHDVRLRLKGSVRATLTPRIIGETELIHMTARDSALAYSVYAALITLIIAALALLAAVGDRVFLTFAGYVAAALLLCGTNNGHVYGLPVLGQLGRLGGAGFLMPVLVFSGAGLHMVAQYAWSPTAAWLDWLRRLGWILLLSSGLVLLPESMAIAVLRPLSMTGWVLAVVLAMLAVFDAGRRGVPMAVAVFLTLLVLASAAGSYELMQAGYLADGVWARFGYQPALVLLSVVAFVGLCSRIGMVRQRLDDETNARRESEHHLRIERLRTGFARDLQAELRIVPADEIAPRAFHLLCGRVRELLGSHDAVVLGHDYLGNDLLLAQAEERSVSPLAQAALVARGIVRAHAQNREPVHLRIDGARVSDDPRATLYAIVPMRLSVPSWAALMVPVRDAQALAGEQLKAVIELTRIAVTSAEEAHASLQLRKTAELDALTGSLNRRALDQALAREFGPAARHAPLSVLFIDIDWFKRVNDEHGHACGDHCLRSVAGALRAELRPGDAFGRYGGEEFLVLLPGHDAASSRVIAERLRQAVEQRAIEWNDTRVMLTISIGMAARRDGDGDGAALLERADKALYAAKREGRNRVCVAPAAFA